MKPNSYMRIKCHWLFSIPVWIKTLEAVFPRAITTVMTTHFSKKPDKAKPVRLIFLMQIDLLESGYPVGKFIKKTRTVCRQREPLR